MKKSTKLKIGDRVKLSDFFMSSGGGHIFENYWGTICYTYFVSLKGSTKLYYVKWDNQTEDSYISEDLEKIGRAGWFSFLLALNSLKCNPKKNK